MIRNNLKVKASAKINLYLNVSKKLREDGYHDIRSIMQSIGLSDKLTFDIREKAAGRTNEKLNGIEILCNNCEISLDDKNHVHFAALKVLESAGRLFLQHIFQTQIRWCSQFICNKLCVK